MIDCLSNPNWLSPQIDFLLFLQNIRIGCSDIIDKFFLSITVFGEFWLPTLICAIAYWCIDFRAGIYLFFLEGINILLAHFLKMLACVYRPWVLSDKIHPSELAVPYAKGYSFPSGHSIMSSSILGGTAYLLRKNKLVCGILIGLILLIGFSRLWLGVHTPQDVVGGLLVGITLIFAVNKITDWAEKESNRYLYLLGVINVLAILALVYISCFNTYRIDYIGGELLVDPKNSINVTYVVYGYALGLLNGVGLCRRFLPFNPHDVSVKIRIIRGIVGTAGIIILLKYVLKNLIMNPVNNIEAFGVLFVIGLIITLIYPVIFTKTEKLFVK